MAPASLRPLPVPDGPHVIRLLPAIDALLAGHGNAVLPVPESDARETALLTTALRVGEPIDNDVALVVSTSGSTGVPKGAMLTSAALTASAAATHARLGGPGRWLLALPAHHIAGLQVLIRSVLAGTTPAVVGVSGGFDVSGVPDALAAMSGRRRYASLVAAQLAKALTDPAATIALGLPRRGAHLGRSNAGETAEAAAASVRCADLRDE